MAPDIGEADVLLTESGHLVGEKDTSIATRKNSISKSNGNANIEKQSYEQSQLLRKDIKWHMVFLIIAYHAVAIYAYLKLPSMMKDHFKTILWRNT